MSAWATYNTKPREISLIHSIYKNIQHENSKLN